jgi:hypothetical protein
MIKSIRTSALAIIACVAVSQSAHAREFADIYTQCGIGAMIAPRNAVVAAISNITTDLGTTAILSNISSPDTCKGSKGKTAMFIHESYDALAADIASGNGKYLDTLASLNHWSPSQKSALTEELRVGFAGAVAANDYSVRTQFSKSEALYNLVMGLPTSNS